jgi:hypothetical protein
MSTAGYDLVVELKERFLEAYSLSEVPCLQAPLGLGNFFLLSSSLLYVTMLPFPLSFYELFVLVRNKVRERVHTFLTQIILIMWALSSIIYCHSKINQ